MVHDVREATLEVLRELRLTTVFANPGSTEVPFLVDLPRDFTFLLGLHEATVVGMATAHALVRDRPSLVNLHTTAGFGNAVGALATARVNRAPLVVLVGQQDRRHLAHQPFLAGELDGLAGRYPVWSDQPTRPQDVPGAVARAFHEARTHRGPAVVVVPMDDWAAPFDGGLPRAAPQEVHVGREPAPTAVAALAARIRDAEAPVVVVGAGADVPGGWAATAALVDQLRCPVWQEAFGARAGIRQDHPRFAGHLPARRGALRDALRDHDLVIALGAPVFRQYVYDRGPLVEPGTDVVVVTEDAAEAHASAASIAVVASIVTTCWALVEAVGARRDGEPPARQPRSVAVHDDEDRLTPAVLYAELDARLPPDTLLIEETPSSRRILQEMMPARRPLGFLSAAMGGLGFALPAAVGAKLADEDRPVVAVVGDGSSLYAIQAVWSAVHYGVGAVFVILANGGYVIMDHLARTHGGRPPWPGFAELSVARIAEGFGCEARRATDGAELTEVLDTALDGLAGRDRPLLLEVEVAP